MDMNRKNLVIIGFIIITIGAIGGYAAYQQHESGTSFLSIGLKGKALVTGDVESFVDNAKSNSIHTIIALDKPSSDLTVKSLSVRSQELRAFSVSKLQPLGISLEYEKTLPAFSMLVADVPINRVDDVAGMSRVRAVVFNEFISVEGGYADIDEVKQIHEIDSLPPADNVVVAIIDSGAPRGVDWIENAVSVADSDPWADFFHGEYVARVVHGVAPQARITSVKTLGPTGTARISTVVEGIQKAATMKPETDVINLSLGTGQKVFSPISYACEVVSREEGIKIVAAAGNTNGGSMTSPASASPVLAVGALTASGDMLTSYSASQFDVLAVGNVIVSGRTLRGTSFSSPVLAGATARWISKFSENDWGRIDLVDSVKSGVFQGAELPILSGSSLSSVDYVAKPSTADVVTPYLLILCLGLTITFVGVKIE